MPLYRVYVNGEYSTTIEACHRKAALEKAADWNGIVVDEVS